MRIGCVHGKIMCMITSLLYIHFGLNRGKYFQLFCVHKIDCNSFYNTRKALWTVDYDFFLFGRGMFLKKKKENRQKKRILGNEVMINCHNMEHNLFFFLSFILFVLRSHPLLLVIWREFIQQNIQWFSNAQIYFLSGLSLSTFFTTKNVTGKNICTHMNCPILLFARKI